MRRWHWYRKRGAMTETKIAIAPTRVRRHPTADNPSKTSLDPNALVTVALDSLATVAAYMYMGAIVSRIEFFSADNLKIEVRGAKFFQP
jgi:hypothetical protein